MSWSYYNFNSNWNTFKTIWYTDIIQTILEEKINNWIVNNNACCIWQKGEPIWFLSDSPYWDDRAMSLTNKYIYDNNIFSNFIKSYHNATGIIFKKKKEAKSIFQKDVVSKLKMDFYPKDGSIESLVLLGGRNYVSSALYKVCTQLFPNREVIYTIDDQIDDVILIPDEKIIFDIEGYMLNVIDNNIYFDPSISNDYYDLLVHEYYYGNIFNTDYDTDSSSIDSF